jgi:alcohol dehydrogenase
VPEVPAGLILGHEGVGVVHEVGNGCTGVKKGDRVVVSCISSCGRCTQCKMAMYSHCSGGGGWLLGHTIDGTQAQYVRIPHADNSLHKVPSGVSEEGLVMLSDILPTALECGVLNGRVKPGDTIAVVGCGPIGLAAILTAQFYSPSQIIAIDIDENRLAKAKALGATHAILNTSGDAAQKVMDLTKGRGVDVSVECLGMPATFDVCQKVVAAGGHVANIGVHGGPVVLELQRLWSHNITLTTALVDTHSTPMLLKMVEAGQLQPECLVSHRFSLQDIMHAYDMFGRAATEKVLKVIIRCDGGETDYKRTEASKIQLQVKAKL